MKVLVCAYACLRDPDRRFGDGGEGILGWNIVKQLARFHCIFVLTSSQVREAVEEMLKKDPTPNIEFYYINLPRWLHPLSRFSGGVQLYAYLWQVKAYFVARHLHRQFHFDVFHHVTYANDWMASFIGALLPIPYIRGPGGGAHRTPKRFFSEYSPGGRLWERLRALGQWLFRHDPFFIMGQRRAQTILVCNHEALEAIPKKWRGKTHLFPVNGVSAKDLALLVHQEIASNKFQVLTAGKLIRIKAFHLVIKAFKIFAKKVPGAELTIVGDGPEFSRLKNLVSQSDFEKKVHFTGWLAREELLQKMLSADVFLFPSLRDGGGQVVVEAMAASLPVICLDIGGPGFHITEECGIKINPNFPEQVIREMAGALEHLYSNKELRLQLGKAARERVEKEYHWNCLGERLQKICQEPLRAQPSQGKMESRS